MSVKLPSPQEGVYKLKLSVRGMVLVAFFAALMAVGAFISKIWPPDVIPFSLLPLLSMLAGVLIGPRLGALSMIVYVLVGLSGVPVLASPPFGGITYVFKPSFGFLLAFPAAAYVSGYIVHSQEKPGWLTFSLAMFSGIIATYVIGLPWMYIIFNFYLGQALTFFQVTAMMGLYIVLDFVKAALGVVVGKTIYERMSKSVELSHSQSKS